MRLTNMRLTNMRLTNMRPTNTRPTNTRAMHTKVTVQADTITIARFAALRRIQRTCMQLSSL